MIIGTIVNGLVIDHIPAGKGMELYLHLGLDKLEVEVALIRNAPSQKYGKKDIIKVAEKIDLDLDLLGFIAPHITVNIIENGEKVSKIHPALPEKLTNVIRCRNPRCITVSEPQLDAIFLLSDAEKRTYRCAYCEAASDK